MKQLKLTLLGTFNAVVNGEPLVNFRSVKVQGLLIYLVLNTEQPHERDVLATLLWSDEPEKVAKHNLRQSLYRLRQFLRDTESNSEPFLLITRSTVIFNTDIEYALDVKDFLLNIKNEALEEAALIYKGDLIPSFSCDSLLFEEWLRAEREKLHRIALDTLFELTDQYLLQADYQKAQNFARQQLTLEPWREEAHQQLMLILALQGDRTAALTQYDACCQMLDEELGIEPSDKTQTLADRIRNQNLEQPVHKKSQRLHPFMTPFVGRHHEYKTLVDAYYQATQNNALQVVSLVGISGIGKTRLAQQFLNWATIQGAGVLYGHAYETSATLPYQSIISLLRQRIERENAPEDLLSDFWLAQLTRILPEIRERYPDLPQPTQEENNARQHLFEAITRLLKALAERQPLILFVDDWHWADSASFDALDYVMQRLREDKLPIFLVLTLRLEVVSESPDLSKWLTQLKRTFSAKQLDISELSQSETTQMLDTLFKQSSDDDPSLSQFSGRLFKETDGQPLFLAETLKELIEKGVIQPPTLGTKWEIDQTNLDEQRFDGYVISGIRVIIQGWLSRITQAANALLSAASILGNDAQLQHIYSVSGLDEALAIDALDELLSKQLLLEEVSSPFNHDLIYRFSHQKVRDVVYAEMGTARRRFLHRRAFYALQTENSEAAKLAYHALKANLITETIHYSLIAGNEAMALFAFNVALTHYETIWQITQHEGWIDTISGADRQSFYLGFGRAYELLQRLEEAQDIYQSMIDYAQAIHAPALECLGFNHLGSIYVYQLDFRTAITLLTQALEIAKENEDLRGLAESEWNLSRATSFNNDAYGAIHHVDRALTIARKLGHPQLLARCLNTYALICAQLRDWHQAERYATEARVLYEESNNRILVSECQRVASFAQTRSGQSQKDLTNLQNVFAFYQQIDDLWGGSESAWVLALSHSELGHYDKAIAFANQGIEQARKMSNQMILVDLALIVRVGVQRAIMDLTGAVKTLSEILERNEDKDLIDFANDWILCEACAVHALSGNWDRAYHFAQKRLQARKYDSVLPMGLTGWYETKALLRGGDDEIARSEVKRLVEIVGDNKRYQLILHRCQAVLAQWDDDTGRAIAYLQDALTLAQEMQLPGEEWSILSALGDLYTAQNEQTEAQNVYKESATIILRLAETIDEDELKQGFLSAKPVKSVLELSEVV